MADAVQSRSSQNVSELLESPGYVNSKLFLNVIAGLFLGFTFYKEPNTVQGLQNKASYSSIPLGKKTNN